MDRHTELIFEEESALAGAPRQLDFGLRMVAPVIMKFGDQEQKDRHLPGILDGSVWWSQGYSEPGAGSDLASLRTTAERDGDYYIVNGQMHWTPVPVLCPAAFGGSGFFVSGAGSQRVKQTRRRGGRSIFKWYIENTKWGKHTINSSLATDL